MKIKVFSTELELDETLVVSSENEIRRQIEDFLSGNRENFDLEISVPDNFTGRVMQEMLKIPRSETRSYGFIGENLGSAAIAVGQACGRNPLPLIVPCHRVVGKNYLGGYCGENDSSLKRKLLDLEGADF